MVELAKEVASFLFLAWVVCFLGMIFLASVLEVNKKK